MYSIRLMLHSNLIRVVNHVLAIRILFLGWPHTNNMFFGLLQYNMVSASYVYNIDFAMTFSKSFVIAVVKRNSYKIILYNNPFNTLFIMAIKTNPNIRVSESSDTIVVSFNSNKSWTSVTLMKEILEKEDFYLLLNPTEDKLYQLFNNYHLRLLGVAETFKNTFNKYLKELNRIEVEDNNK